ncbi:hypothetical protein [Paenibacillus hexagrammi]|uniref:DNA sulfur modification protein DndD n=1 Tax=Paenibacillus hexagrammi TaxID=2908839 RepID=A0ABY3SHI6_9BACL|nr:hypothetical protein [Paenibacillus sp. YPD9-1]UJF32656.1 hypothetical protein L0M14_24005 [Paenibacillus sp. YPD9-1]
MNSEQNVETYEQIQKVITQETILEILAQLSSESNINIGYDNSSKLHEKLISKFKPDNKQIIHRASFAQKTELQSLRLLLEKISIQTYINMYEENAALLERIQELKRQLDTNDNSSEFKILLQEIEYLSQKIEHTRAIIEKKQMEELLKTEQLKMTRDALEIENNKLSQFRKSATSLILADKILSVSKRFQEIQMRKKLDQVQNEAIKMIQNLFRKKKYITRLYISHETFDLQLFHHHELLSKERLSAGEKEMLMLSIIWAMFKTTGWKLPLVFDTLLGRLDQDHKRELLTSYLPRCGDQVIVLATDSEISTSQFKDLKRFLSRSYTLEFNVSSESININQDHYFDIYELELV